MSMSVCVRVCVCVCVCLSVRERYLRHYGPTWLGPLLAALRCGVYFRFYVWRRVWFAHNVRE